jgi:hypothetical protein
MARVKDPVKPQENTVATRSRLQWSDRKTARPMFCNEMGQLDHAELGTTNL